MISINSQLESELKLRKKRIKGFVCVRENCEELRTVLSKRSAKSLNAEREKQLLVKQERERQNMLDEEFFMDLWKTEIDRKADREVSKSQQKH